MYSGLYVCTYVRTPAYLTASSEVGVGGSFAPFRWLTIFDNQRHTSKTPLQACCVQSVQYILQLTRRLVLKRSQPQPGRLADRQQTIKPVLNVLFTHKNHMPNLTRNPCWRASSENCEFQLGLAEIVRLSSSPLSNRRRTYQRYWVRT